MIVHLGKIQKTTVIFISLHCQIGIFLGYSLLQLLEYLAAGVIRIAINFKGNKLVVSELEANRGNKFGNALSGSEVINLGPELEERGYCECMENLEMMREEMKKITTVLKDLKVLEIERN